MRINYREKPHSKKSRRLTASERRGLAGCHHIEFEVIMKGKA